MFRTLCLIGTIMPLVVSNNVTVTKRNSKDKDILRIVNGKPAKLGQFYYHVSVKEHAPELEGYAYKNICGGTLIGESKVLTAAHCFEKEGNDFETCCKKPQFFKANKFQLVAGSINNYQEFEAEGQWRAVERFAAPGNYWLPDRDIAIAHSKKPFVLDNQVNTLPLARKHIDYGAIQCEVAGFGRTKYRDIYSYSEVLMWVNLELIPAGRCSRIHGQNMRDFVCTSILKSNVLEGDSGSPLVCHNTGDPNDKGKGVAVGIESSAINERNVFTRISSYNDFIDRGVGCQTSCPVSYIVLLSLIISNIYTSAFTNLTL